MPGTTTRGFPYSSGSDDANTLDETTQALAERCREEYREGTFSSRPSAGAATAGRVYYATDTGDYWIDTGTGWRFAGSAVVHRPSASQISTTVPAGPSPTLASLCVATGLDGLIGIDDDALNAALTHVTQMKFTAAGIWRVSGSLSKTGGSGGLTVEGLFGAGVVYDIGSADLTGARRPFVVQGRVAINDVFAIQAYHGGTGSATLRLDDLIIERVSP